MSSGKETPRQKMIGMMYLVLTALLALNVSKQILKGFVTVDENIGKSKEILTENNARLKKTFEDYVSLGNAEARAYLLKAIEAQKYTNAAHAYLDSVKMMVISRTEKMQKPDTSQMRFMEKLDDFDTPTYLLIGDDEASPKKGKYSATELRGELTGLYDKLNKLVDDMQKDKHTEIDAAELKALKEKLATIKPVDRNIDDDGVKLNWELENFYHLPLAAVVTNLDKMQADVRNIESEFLHVFSASATKGNRITKLVARVMAPSAYVQTGEAFKADILLSAGSTEMPADRMKVLVGAKYDPATNKVIQPGEAIGVEEGIGKYSTTASSPGEHSIDGVIVYKNTKGEEEYYPFDYKYMVAAPFTAVAADNMNVLYVGVDNPITVSAAGIAPTELVVTANGCNARLSPAGPGKYNVSVSSAGNCTVSVAARTAQGLKPQGRPQVFRVKSIPPPVAKIAGLPNLSTLELTSAQIASIGGISAVSLGFEFPVNFKVTSYNVVTVINGIYNTEPSNGPNLSEKARNNLKKLNKGQRAYFEDIKVQTPTGIVSVPNATIRLK